MQKKSKMNKLKTLVPQTDSRYDNLGHWVEFDGNHSRSRCKLPGCKGFTHIFCTKCEVHLCCMPGRNCFRDYHEVKPVKQVKRMTPKKSESKQAGIAKRSVDHLSTRQCGPSIKIRSGAKIGNQNIPLSTFNTQNCKENH